MTGKIWRDRNGSNVRPSDSHYPFFAAAEGSNGAEGATFSAAAILAITNRLGLRRTRSIPPEQVKSIWASRPAVLPSGQVRLVLSAVLTAVFHPKPSQTSGCWSVASAHLGQCPVQDFGGPA